MIYRGYTIEIDQADFVVRRSDGEEVCRVKSENEALEYVDRVKRLQTQKVQS